MKKLITILIVIFLLPLLIYGQGKEFKNPIFENDLTRKKETLDAQNSEMMQSSKMTSNYSIINLSSQPPVMSPDATTILNPNGDGGFETGTTFVANGWSITSSSGGYRPNNWQIGTACTGYTGNRCAFVGPRNNTYGNGVTVWYRSYIHLYRTITFPANETAITISFSYKQPTVQTVPPYYDWASLFLLPSGTTPLGDSVLEDSGYIPIWQNITTSYAGFTTITFNIPASYAGTTKVLCFQWANDYSAPWCAPGLDNISVTSRVPSTFTSTETGGDWGQSSTWIGGVVPNGDNVIINGPVNVETTHYCNDITVNSGKTLTIANVSHLGLYVGGNGTINGNINIGGTNGGAIVFNYGTTGRTFSVNNGAVININYLLNIYYGALSVSSGGTVNIGTSGQLALQGEAASIIASGGSLVNNNNGASYLGLYVRYENSTLTVNGSLTSNNGNFYFASASINIMINNGTLYWNNGNFSSTYGFSYNTSASTLVYGGSANYNTSIYEFPTSNRPFNLGINMGPGNTVTLDNNRTVNGTLTMTNGIVNTGSYTLMLGTGTTARGNYVSGNARIVTGSTGGFKRWFTNATVNNVYFPVGTATTINMITLSFTGAPTTGGSLTAKFVALSPGTNSSTTLDDEGYMIDTYSQRGYWQLDAGDGLSGGTYDLSLRGQGFNPNYAEITNYTQVRVLKRTGAGFDWSVVGSTHVNAEGSNEDPIIKRESLSGFSQFGMGGNSGDGNPFEGPLPVKLTSFSSAITGRDVKLTWVTESEENNEGFEVQKSEYRIQESEIWNKIGFVQGKGMKNSPTNYSYEDRSLQTGRYKYRLKQIDYNGNFEYFELAGLVEVGVPAKFDLSQNYPNPFNPVTKINFDIPQSGLVSLKIYDVLGKEVSTIVNEMKDAGYYTVSFDAAGLSSGVYFYRLSSNGFSSIKRLVVLK